MDIFHAIADPTRRGIIELLAKKGTLSASEITHQFHVSGAAISQHLKVLREADVVHVEKNAQQRLYHINSFAFTELQGWAKNMTEVWNERFDALDKVLEIEKKKLKAKKKNT